MKPLMITILGLLAAIGSAQAELKDRSHPFLLWTKEEAAAIRKRIETDPLAKKQYDKMASTEIGRGNPTLWNLFNYLVLGDQAAGAREKAELLKFIGRLPEPLTEEFKAKLAAKIAQAGGDYDKIWTRGNSSVSDAHQRDEQTLNTLRYDLLYDELTPEQRAGVEKSMRAYIQFHLDGAKPRHPDFHYTRMGWLPNMHWPRAIGTHLMAVALKDEKAIEAMFNSEGGWKWFFDAYITDGQFYNEEFCKYYSNIGTMLMYCEALEELGLGKYGYGYTGQGGATMKNLLYMPIKVGFPRLDVPDATLFPAVTMGDAGEFFTVQSSHRPGKTASWWSNAHMNGPLPKLQAPGWFEIGHNRWPEAGYGYFLGQMRQPGEEIYLPSLFFGVGPVDPKKVAAPPAPSYVTRERGFALLRAEESSAYWESPAPAVAMQFGMYYVHYVHDCFAMLNYVAFNREIYKRMGAVGKGYAGNDPWRDHVNGQSSGVVVDGLKATPVDSGEQGCKNQRIREHLAGPAKFVACRAKGVYPGVDQERVFVLTGDYLYDLFWLKSDKPRVYDWHVLAAGQVAAPADWQPAPVEKAVITDQKSFEAGNKPWSVLIHQNEALDQVGGVRVAMLSEEGTTITQGRPPIGEKGLGVKVVASRTKPATLFAGLHQPYNGPAAQAPAAKFERIAQTEDAIAVSINNDRVLVAIAEGAGTEQTLTGNGESFTFTDFGFVRVGPDKVEVTGSVKAGRVKVSGSPKLVINGTERPQKPAAGWVVW